MYGRVVGLRLQQTTRFKGSMRGTRQSRDESVPEDGPRTGDTPPSRQRDPVHRDTVPWRGLRCCANLEGSLMDHGSSNKFSRTEESACNRGTRLDILLHHILVVLWPRIVARRSPVRGREIHTSQKHLAGGRVDFALPSHLLEPSNRSQLSVPVRTMPGAVHGRTMQSRLGRSLGQGV